jgi:NADPH2:quinone reductase
VVRDELLTGFEEAATIPLVGLTAAVSLFRNLELPPPWSPASDPIPLVVYGASSSVGSFALKLARASNIHPIIAIAGNGSSYVETLLDRSKGDIVIDYRDGPDATIDKIQIHLKAGNYSQPKHGMDPGIGPSSQKVLTEIVAPDGAINLVLPSNYDVGSATKTLTSVGVVHNQDDGAHGPDAGDLALVVCRWFTKALQAGTLKGHPFEVRPGGLEGVEQALRDLKGGRASAVKYVFHIADTPGI